MSDPAHAPALDPAPYAAEAEPARPTRDDLATLPPGPRLPALAQAALLGVRPLAFVEHCRRRYGDAFTLRFPGAPPIVAFAHPDAVKQIFTGGADALHAGEANAQLGPLLGWSSLLLLDGARHLEERRLLMPPFHGERMEAYAVAMRAVADAAIDTWPVGRAFPILREMQAITLDVILRVVFGFEEEGERARLRALLRDLVRVAANPLWLVPALRVDLGPLTPWRALTRARRRVAETLRAEFARRRTMPSGQRSDILSMVLEARYEDGRAMTDAELCDEMITLLLAGHETTATALAWTTYHVLRTHGLAERVRAEIDAVTGGGDLEAGHLLRLELLDAVVKEGLRINPVLDDVGRVVKRPVEIGGWRLPAGVAVAPQIHLVHHRADLYPDPDRFDPERFLGRRTSPYEFLPFGGGTRRCLGMAFALYEMKVVLARVLGRADLRLASRHPARPVRRAITLVPSGGVRVVLQRAPGS